MARSVVTGCMASSISQKHDDNMMIMMMMLMLMMIAVVLLMVALFLVMLATPTVVTMRLPRIARATGMVLSLHSGSPNF